MSSKYIILLPEKYGERGSPVLARKRSMPLPPCAASLSQMSAVRVSFHTRALW